MSLEKLLRIWMPAFKRIYVLLGHQTEEMLVTDVIKNLNNQGNETTMTLNKN